VNQPHTEVYAGCQVRIRQGVIAVLQIYLEIGIEIDLIIPEHVAEGKLCRALKTVQCVVPRPAGDYVRREINLVRKGKKLPDESTSPLRRKGDTFGLVVSLS